MITFKNLRTGEIKEAFSAREVDGKIHIRFKERGKEYCYSKSNVEIIDGELCNQQDVSKQEDNKKDIIVYTFEKECYKCHRKMEILTYIIFDDGTNDNLVFPWDKERLLKRQNLMAHIQNPSIEYYGLSVLGDNEEYDQIFLSKYAERIQNRYSNIQKRIYPMNLCQHCGAQQGEYYLYEQTNDLIKCMEKIKIFDILRPDEILELSTLGQIHFE